MAPPPKDPLSGIHHLLWDWNGTLIDDVDLCVAVISQLCLDAGRAAIDRGHYRAHFGFPVIRFYRHLGFSTEAQAFAEISEVFIATYYARFAAESRIHLAAVDFARAWQKRGGRQAVLSASRQDHLESAVAQFGLSPLFERLGGIADIYAGGKVTRGRELLHELGWDPAKTLLLGDTDHDAEVAAELGVRCLLIAQGHQSADRLRRTGCPVVESLTALGYQAR